MLLFKYRDVDVPQGACKSSLDSPLQIIEQAVGLGVGLMTKAPVSKQEFSFS